MTVPIAGRPRFDHPSYTRPADALVTAIEPQPPLPALIDPPTQPVVEPSDEPLVPIADRRIRLLSNYWHAGWAHAEPVTWLRSGTMARLSNASASLPAPFGLAVFDGWRPLALQAELFAAAYADPALPPGFVAEPIADPCTPPPHLTGGTVDCTLTFEGTPLALGTDFDDFSADAHTGALESEPGVARELRRLLYRTMHDAGFVVLHCEWWHFEFGTRRWAAIRSEQPRYGPAVPPTR